MAPPLLFSVMRAGALTLKRGKLERDLDFVSLENRGSRLLSLEKSVRKLWRRKMLHYALVFLIVGLIAGALGLAGVAALAGQIAWILFLIGIVLIVIHLASGHRPPAL
jgi:uncharacterized membrane protein YtjA (UPF0391 family)